MVPGEEKYSGQYGKFKLLHITEKVSRFLDCGDYSKGVAKISCTNPNCDHEYFLPFSCKSWFLCPSCHQKRLRRNILRLYEWMHRMHKEVLLKLPHRQYVFILPKMLRPYFRFNPNLFAGLSKIISSILTEYYNEVSGERLQTGIAVSYQTYGEFSRFNPHRHCIVMEGGVDGEEKFYFLPIKNTSKLCELFRRKVILLLMKQNLLDEPRTTFLLNSK